LVEALGLQLLLVMDFHDLFEDHLVASGVDSVLVQLAPERQVVM
jgi:hypothetical protein